VPHLLDDEVASSSPRAGRSASAKRDTVQLRFSILGRELSKTLGNLRGVGSARVAQRKLPVVAERKVIHA